MKYGPSWTLTTRSAVEPAAAEYDASFTGIDLESVWPPCTQKPSPVGVASSPFMEIAGHTWSVPEVSLAVIFIVASPPPGAIVCGTCHSYEMAYFPATVHCALPSATFGQAVGPPTRPVPSTQPRPSGTNCAEQTGA